MTLKENLIKVIIDMDEQDLARLEQFVNEMLWQSIPEELPSQEESKIFDNYKSGVEEFQGIYSLEEI